MKVGSVHEKSEELKILLQMALVSHGCCRQGSGTNCMYNGYIFIIQEFNKIWNFLHRGN